MILWPVVLCCDPMIASGLFKGSTPDHSIYTSYKLFILIDGLMIIDIVCFHYFRGYVVCVTLCSRGVG